MPPVAIKAMKAGKHVFCEKLMAHSVGECKAMVRSAHKENKLLAIGHQRHYSALYDNANYLVQNGHLGEIRHIRALWHRNQATPVWAKDKTGKFVYDDKGDPVYVKDDAGNIVYHDSWKPPIPPDDANIDFKKYGYKSIEELVRWRLYDRTGAGLMAELGSHQLDACSIFLGKKHPICVTGIGGSFFYTDGREVDDHVFVAFEFPGKDGPQAKERVVVTYSSINTNQFDKYGETVMGTRGHDAGRGGEGPPLLPGVRPQRGLEGRRLPARPRSRWPTPRESRSSRPARASRDPRPPRRWRTSTARRIRPHEAIARSSSTSPTASATATRATSTTRPTTSSGPAAGARSPWPTPSSP